MAAKEKSAGPADQSCAPAVHQVDGCQPNNPTLQRQWQYMLDALKGSSPSAASLLNAHGQLIAVSESVVEIALPEQWRPLLERRKALLSELAKGREVSWVEPPPAPIQVHMHGAGQDPSACTETAEAATADELIDRAAAQLAAAFNGVVVPLDPETSAELVEACSTTIATGEKESLLTTLRRACRADAQSEEAGQ